MKKRKLVKRRWIIAGIIVLVIIAVLAVLYLWQQENIKAAANARRYTQKELEQQLVDSRNAVQSALEEHPEITVRDLTDEERTALRAGEMTPEELIGILTGSTASSSAEASAPLPEQAGSAQTESPGTASDSGVTSETLEVPSTASAGASTAAPDTTDAPDVTEAPHEPTAQELYEKRLSELVAEVYVMREQYTATLDSMMAQAKAEYSAKPESERTKSKLASWAAGYSSRAQALEKECDAWIKSSRKCGPC